MTAPLSAGTKRSAKMVSIFNRNNKLYIQYIAYGKTKQKSTRLEDTPENRKFIEKEIIPALERKILNGDFDGEKPQKFSFYSQKYLRKKQSKKTYKKMCMFVDVLNETFGDMTVNKIRVSHVDDWVALKLASNSPKTVRNYLSTMSGILKEAIHAEVISKNIATGIELPIHIAKETKPFTSGEVRQLLHGARGNLKLLIAIGFMTGLRTGEIMALKAEDFDLENGVLYVKRAISGGELKTPKTEKSIRMVPIFNDLLPYLQKLPKMGFLFCKEDGNHYAAFPGHYKKAWDELLQDCGIEYRKIYATRHTFIVNMIKNSNLDILKISQMVGHTTIKMIVQNYAKYIENEHLNVNRDLDLFTDNSTDSVA